MIIKQLEAIQNILDNYNLDLNAFPSISGLMENLDIPYGHEVVYLWIGELMSRRANKYWNIPYSEENFTYIDNRLHGLKMDWEGDNQVDTAS